MSLSEGIGISSTDKRANEMIAEAMKLTKKDAVDQLVEIVYDLLHKKDQVYWEQHARLDEAGACISKMEHAFEKERIKIHKSHVEQGIARDRDRDLEFKKVRREADMLRTVAVGNYERLLRAMAQAPNPNRMLAGPIRIGGRVHELQTCLVEEGQNDES